MKTTKLEFIAKITTPDGKEILKRVSEDILQWSCLEQEQLCIFHL